MRTPEDEVAKISLKPNRYQSDRKLASKPEVSDSMTDSNPNQFLHRKIKNKIFAQMNIKGSSVIFQVDCGSTVSVLPLETYRTYSNT